MSLISCVVACHHTGQELASKPPAAAAVPLVSRTAPSSSSSSIAQAGTGATSADADATAGATVADTASSSTALPNGWHQYTDQNGHPYYYNSITNVSQWNPPQF